VNRECIRVQDIDTWHAAYSRVFILAGRCLGFEVERPKVFAFR
jgi:hypothetical protein